MIPHSPSGGHDPRAEYRFSDTVMLETKEEDAGLINNLDQLPGGGVSR
jgi:hypothetical protein